MSNWTKTPIRGILLDMTGTLCDTNSFYEIESIEGSSEALLRLREANIPIRFVTNESQVTRALAQKKLEESGFFMNFNEIFAPVPVACQIMKERNLRPHLLVHSWVLPDFDEIDKTDPNCVVVGDAIEGFTYKNVNKAFQTLMQMENPILFGLGSGKYYKHGDCLQIDVGAYLAALEYSSGVKAEILGKPSASFFLSAVRDMNLKPEEVVMIGDDILNDVGGAQAVGIRGVLVRTGKFRPTDENHPTVHPDAIVDNLSSAVDLILKHRK